MATSENTETSIVTRTFLSNDSFVNIEQFTIKGPCFNLSIDHSGLCSIPCI